MVDLVRIRWIIDFVKRSLFVLGMASALSFAPVYAHAVTTSASPGPTSTATVAPTPTPGHSANSKNRAARDAARALYRAALFSAQNGRDLAFADANATLMQSLQTAGTDKVARKAAQAVYRSAAQGIIKAYKQSIATALQNYKAAIAALGK